ncbi:MAG TPA: NlpC/P60 family protein [Limnobacter sp.]|nr:NlpC/P60 family protein [Limnobacter sp.]
MLRRFRSVGACVVVVALGMAQGDVLADSDQLVLEQTMTRVQPLVGSQVFDQDLQQATEISKVQLALLTHYAEWEGTRHRLGGTSQKGVDCSSFIQTLFKDHFSIELPRSSREQMILGEPVAQHELQTGDLLFFRTGPTRKHVGVYMGNNQFMHVSARRGVEIAKLLTPYWQKHFITARRVGLNIFKPSN